MGGGMRDEKGDRADEKGDADENWQFPRQSHGPDLDRVLSSSAGWGQVLTADLKLLEVYLVEWGQSSSVGWGADLDRDLQLLWTGTGRQALQNPNDAWPGTPLSIR